MYKNCSGIVAHQVGEWCTRQPGLPAGSPHSHKPEGWLIGVLARFGFGFGLGLELSWLGLGLVLGLVLG